MAPKSKTAVVAAPKPTYKDMIKSAIVTLKERNGSSRQAIKKYVQSNFDVKTGNFDALFNTALRKGVDAGDFAQPKGPSGPVKVKVIAKPTAKPASKPVVKSVSKPVAKKIVKKSPVKKTTAKPLAKKVGKKTSAKPTKTTAKKVVKPTKKPAAKKKVTKK